MRVETGDLWGWDDGNVEARVVRSQGGKILTEHPFGPGVEQLLAQRLEKYGEHVHSFQPNPDKGRPYWLVTFPVDDEGRSAAELLVWAWAMLSRDTTVVMPPAVMDISPILNTAARISGDDKVESIAHRFVVVNQPKEILG